MAANRVKDTQIRPMTVHTFLDGDAVWPVSSSQEHNCIRMAGSIGDVKSLTLTLSLCYNRQILANKRRPAGGKYTSMTGGAQGKQHI